MKIKLIICFFSGFYSTIYCQDPFSSHFFLLNSFYNPACSGIGDYTDLILNYRKHLPGLNNSYNTYKGGINGYEINKKMGLSLLVTRDVTGNGTFSATNVDIIYHYIIKLNITTIVSFGFQSSLFQKGINYSGISEIPVWASSYSVEPGFKENRFFPDFSTGATVSSEKFNMGFCVFHLLEPKEARENQDTKLKRRFIFQSDYLFRLNSMPNEIKQFKPSLLIDYQNNNVFLTIGTVYITKIFEPGFWIRQEFFSINSSSIILSSKINFLNLYIVYSFDMLISNSYISLSNFGTHEVTLGYHIKYKGKRKNLNGTINCPYE